MRVHLLITRHRAVWRVRILIPGERRPRWRAYRAADYPTPEAVARRCVKGLLAVAQHKAQKEQEYCDNASHWMPPLRVRWECWGRLEAIGRA